MSHASPKYVLACFCLASFTQGSIINGLFPAVVSTFEARFNFVSSQSAAISSSYHFGSLIALPLLTYVGGFGRKNLWVGWGMFCFGIGTMLFAVPHFTAPFSSTTNEKTLLCASNLTENLDNACQMVSLKNYLIYFILINIWNGATTVPLYSLGVVYIHENVPKVKSSLYQGIFFSFAVIGVAGGYYLGGISLNYKIAIDGNTSHGTETWWLGFLVAGFFSVIISIPIIMLPKVEPTKRSSEFEPKDNTKRISFSNAINDGYELLRNPIFILINIVSALDFFTFIGLNTFLVKYMHFNFGMTETKAASYIGTVLVLAGVGGQIVGGLIGMKFQDVVTVIKFILGFTLIAAILSTLLLIRSPDMKVAGVNTEYPNRSLGIKTCFSDCNCNIYDYQPVCGEDNVTYFSPCLAGCKTSSELKSYSNCSCLTSITNGSAVSGSCLSKLVTVATRSLVISLIFCFIFCVFMGKVIQIQIVLSTVKYEQLQSYALGIQWIFVRLFGAIPGPLIYGKIADLACLNRSRKCDVTGSCRLYDNNSLSNYMFFTCLSERVVNCFLLLLTLWFSRRLNQQLTI